jgi:DNA gyrase subunit A
MADEDLIPETDIVVVLSKDGFLRRKSLEEYSLQGRGGKGRKGASVPEEDEIMILAVTNTHKDIFLFTSKGRVLAVKGYMIPESKNGKGRHVSKFVSIEEDERVVSMYGRGVEDSKYIFLITRNGTAKRLEISELASLTRAGKRVLSLDEGDEIAKVRLTSGSDDLLLMTESGQALRVPEVEFRSMGRSARGVRAMRLDPGDCVIGCDIVHPAKTSLIISQRGVGKRTEYDDFTTHHRGGGGVRAMNLGRKTGVLVGCWGVSDDDEVIAITNRGRMIRVAASEIPLLSRGATGSITVRLDEGDMVADVSVVPGDVSREAVPAPQVRDGETPLLAEEEE